MWDKQKPNTTYKERSVGQSSIVVFYTCTLLCDNWYKHTITDPFKSAEAIISPTRFTWMLTSHSVQLNRQRYSKWQTSK